MVLTCDEEVEHEDPLLGQVGGAQGGSRLALPPGTCWTWTPSPSPTQVGGGAGQRAWHGTDTARHGSLALLPLSAVVVLFVQVSGSSEWKEVSVAPSPG